MFTRFRLRDYDYKLILMILALSVIGILAVGSAEPSLQKKQCVGVIAGFVIMFIISVVNYSWVIKLNWIMYAMNLGLLLGVKFLGDTGVRSAGLKSVRCVSNLPKLRKFC